MKKPNVNLLLKSLTLGHNNTTIDVQTIRYNNYINR